MSANEKFILYAKITDNAGNDTIISSSGIVVYTDSEATVDGGSFIKTSTDDIEVTITMNGNTVKSIMNGNDILTEGDDYTVDSGKVTLKNSYLKSLVDGTQTFTITWYPLGEPGWTENIKVTFDLLPLSALNMTSSHHSIILFLLSAFALWVLYNMKVLFIVHKTAHTKYSYF